MAESKHVVIVGAGVIGLCTAYYCARRGHRVTVIDRSSAEHEGCSYGNAGMVVPSHFVPLAAPGMVALGLKWMRNPESPFYIKPRLDGELLNWAWKFWRAANARHVKRSAPLLRDLQFASRTCFEELSELPDNDFGLVQRGLIMLCKTQHAFDHEAKYAAEANELGVLAEVLDAQQLAEVDPGVTMDVAGGILFPKDCHLSPHRFMAGLKQQLDKLGVEFRWNTEVAVLPHRGSQQSRTRFCRLCEQSSSHEILADEFVLAGGSWSPVLARELELQIPMQAGKGYSLTLAQPRQVPQLCSIFTEARVAATPMGDTLRFGGTMEIAGLNEEINPVRVQGIIKSVPNYFPEFTLEDFAEVKPWCGLRPCSPDGLPYLGRTEKFSNLTLATGHAMMGLSLGPISGKLVSEVVSGEEPSFDLALLNPDRYA
jgi:D-amino-acid dehydrogenase